MRTAFQTELEQLEASLQEEGALVLRVLRGALNALAQRDLELTDEVIAFDDDVDRQYLQIEEGIQVVCSRGRRRLRAIFGSCSRCCTSTSTSSGWPTTASRSPS